MNFNDVIFVLEDVDAMSDVVKCRKSGVSTSRHQSDINDTVICKGKLNLAGISTGKGKGKNPIAAEEGNLELAGISTGKGKGKHHIAAEAPDEEAEAPANVSFGTKAASSKPVAD